MESLQVDPVTSACQSNSPNSASSSYPMPMLSPSSTIVRVRRKRSAGPLSGLVVSSKRAKASTPSTTAAEEGSSSRLQRDENEETEPDGSSKMDGEMEQGDEVDEDVIFLTHVGTSSLPHAKSAAPFLKKEHKVVELIDYNPESGSLGKRKLSVLDHGYLEVMRAAKAINDFGLDERERKEFESASTAPLAKAELALLDDFDEVEESSADAHGSKEEDYVYDFYCTPHNQIPLFPADKSASGSGNFQVRLPTDEELQLYFGGDDDDASAEMDDDSDSNAEGHFKNDYPDEEENDTTSDDESNGYDHYGDEEDEYGKHLWRGDQAQNYSDEDDD